MTSDLLAHLMHVVEVADRHHLIARADREILEMALVKQAQDDGVFTEFEQDYQELVRQVYWSRQTHAT
jgi:hypothetical protein